MIEKKHLFDEMEPLSLEEQAINPKVTINVPV